MMRILYHHRTQGRGVEAVHIMGTVREWRKMGHVVEILSPPGVQIESGHLSSGNGRPSALSMVLRSLIRLVPEILFEVMELFYNLFALSILSRSLSNGGVDMIFERYSLLTLAGAWYAKRRSIPFFLEVNYTTYTPLFRKRSAVLMPVARMMERFIFKNATGLVAVSSCLNDQLVSMGVDTGRIITLPNAADPAVFKARKAPEELLQRLGIKGRRVVGFVGFFYPWHGLDLMIEAVPQVLARVPETVFLLIGDGPTKRELEKKVSEQGYGSSVRFLGRLRHEELPDYISLFDVAVVPHSNDYGSPMKVFEYMAVGKPVVAPDLGPLRDGITSGKEGILFAPGDAAALGTAITEILGDERTMEMMSSAARRKVETERNWAYNATEILMLYGRVLKK